MLIALNKPYLVHCKFTDDQGSVWRYRKPAHPASYMQVLESGEDMALEPIESCKPVTEPAWQRRAQWSTLLLPCIRASFWKR